MGFKSKLQAGAKKIFVPLRTPEEKISLKMTKQGYMCQAFYLAMAMALIVTVVKLAMKRPFSDYVWEEMIFFVPILYFAIRHSSTNLKNMKKINVDDSKSVLVFVAVLAAVTTFLLGVAGMVVYSLIQGFALEISAALIICAVAGLLVGAALYFIIYLFIKNKA